MLKQRHQYRMLQASFVFALIGIAFFGSSAGMRASEYVRTQPVKHGNQQIDYLSALWLWVTHDATGFFTVILCFITGALAAFTALLYRSTTTIAVDAKKSIIAAESAAEGSQRAAATAKLSMEASGRAYIHFAGCRWISHTDTTDGSIFWSIRPQWTNSGGTPTRRANIYVHYELLDTELSADYPFTPDPKIISTPTLIAPTSGITSGLRNIEGEDLVAIREGRKHFYIWGVVRYRDVFPETSAHVTKFCVYAASITGDPLAGYDAKANPVEIIFAHYRRHNCADEDCGE